MKRVKLEVYTKTILFIALNVSRYYMESFVILKATILKGHTKETTLII